MKSRLTLLLPLAAACLIPLPASAHTYNVEIDWLEKTGAGAHTHRPTDCELDAIKAAFARKGHTWNYTLGNSIDETAALQTIDFVNSNPPTVFDCFDRTSGDWFDIESVHRAGGGNRYMVFGHNYSLDGTFTTSSGLAELPGDECVVTLGSFSGQIGTAWDRAGTAMHEFGHNIGLRHAGNQNESLVRQYKPNFPSVMAYRYQLIGVKYGLQCQGLSDAANAANFFDLDYSNGTLASRDETALNECNGIGLGTQVDWDCDSSIDPCNTTVPKDISSQGSGLYGINWCGAAGGLQTITDYDDWGNVAAGPSFTSETQEVVSCITFEEAEKSTSVIDCPTQPNPCTPTAAQISVINSAADPDRVSLAWFTSDGAVVATLYRSSPESDWVPVAQLRPDGTGRMSYEDHGVIAGARYGYRLGIFADGQESYLGEVWVDVPARFHLAVAGMRPNPSNGDAIVLSFSVPVREAVTIEMLDVTGRRVLARDLGTLEIGSHVVNLGERPRLSPGIYLVRLTQAGHSVSTKVSFMR